MRSVGGEHGLNPGRTDGTLERRRRMETRPGVDGSKQKRAAPAKERALSLRRSAHVARMTRLGTHLNDLEKVSWR
jgi:hypothetical protein